MQTETAYVKLTDQDRETYRAKRKAAEATVGKVAIAKARAIGIFKERTDRASKESDHCRTVLRNGHHEATVYVRPDYELKKAFFFDIQTHEQVGDRPLSRDELQQRLFDLESARAAEPANDEVEESAQVEQ